MILTKETVMVHLKSVLLGNGFKNGTEIIGTLYDSDTKETTSVSAKEFLEAKVEVKDKRHLLVNGEFLLADEWFESFVISWLGVIGKEFSVKSRLNDEMVSILVEGNQFPYDLSISSLPETADRKSLLGDF